MKLWIRCGAWLAWCCLPVAPLQAQNLEDMVSKYTSENGQGYLQPLADAFGANLNSGLYHTARIEKAGWHLDFGVEMMLAPTGDDRKVFTAQTQDPCYPPSPVAAPTVFGSSEGASVTGTGGTVFNFPGGFEVNRLPLAVPQLSVGSVLGTEAMVRYISLEVDDNIGRVRLFGMGARHSVSQYLEDPPLDLAAAFFIQSFDVGDIVEANTTYFGLQGSYTRGLVTLYGGPGIESSSLDIAYDLDSGGEGSEVRFELDGANSVRFTIGAALDLAILRLHADYSLASQGVFAFGLGLGR